MKKKIEEAWKETHICVYKKYSIKYGSQGKFYAIKRGGIPLFHNDKESYVKRSIDNFIDIEERKVRDAKVKKYETKIEAKKVKELKKSMENITSHRATFDMKELKSLIFSANGYTSEARLTFKNKELTFTELDPANVALIFFKLKFKGKANTEACINLNDLTTSIKTISKKGMFTKCKEITISFRAKRNEEDKVMVLSNGFGEMTLPCIELYEKQTKVPKLKFNTKVKIKKNELRKYLNMCNLVAESVIMKVVKNKLYISANGDLSEYNSKAITTASGRNCRSKYSYEYLRKNFVPGNELVVKFGTDYPLQIEDENGNIFILAPRVE